MATELLWIGASLGLYLTSIGVAAWRLGKLANVSQNCGERLFHSKML